VIRQVGKARKGRGSVRKKTLHFGRQTDYLQFSTSGHAQPGILLTKFESILSPLLPPSRWRRTMKPTRHSWRPPFFGPAPRIPLPGRYMSDSKPKFIEPIRAVCPVCGTTSYSQGGIHPQCAVVKADRILPRPKDNGKSVKASLGQWRKRCPRCKRDLPARRMVCDCGHSFQPGVTRRS